MASQWIQNIGMKKGALRATAKRHGLLKGDEKLSDTDLSSLSRLAKRTGNHTLNRRVNLARTLKKF